MLYNLSKILIDKDNLLQHRYNIATFGVVPSVAAAIALLVSGGGNLFLIRSLV
jgi:hypothetical protein